MKEFASEAYSKVLRKVEDIVFVQAKNPALNKTIWLELTMELIKELHLSDRNPQRVFLVYYVSYLYEKTNFFESSASTKYHGANQFGLIKHSYDVLRYLLKLAEEFPDKIRFSPADLITAALFHDVCKVGLYYYDEEKKKWMKNYNTRASGHGIESVRRMEAFYNEFCIGNPEFQNPEARSKALNPDVLEAIQWHMGWYDISPYTDEYYHEAKNRNPLVLALHYADDISCCWK